MPRLLSNIHAMTTTFGLRLRTWYPDMSWHLTVHVGNLYQLLPIWSRMPNNCPLLPNLGIDASSAYWGTGS